MNYERYLRRWVDDKGIDINTDQPAMSYEEWLYKEKYEVGVYSMTFYKIDVKTGEALKDEAGDIIEFTDTKISYMPRHMLEGTRSSVGITKDTRVLVNHVDLVKVNKNN